MASPLKELKDFTVGQLAALVRNVGGPSNVEAINRVGNISDAVAKFLEGRNGLRIFTCRVDKSHRAFQPFSKNDFTYVEPSLKPEHFQLKGTGVQDREFKIINLWERFPEGHVPTTQELLDLVKAEGEDPDFADTKVFLRDNPGEATDEHPLFSLCGSVVDRGGGRYVAFFLAYSVGRVLSWSHLGSRWERYGRLLVACK